MPIYNIGLHAMVQIGNYFEAIEYIKLKRMDMKKNYLLPEIDVREIELDTHLLNFTTSTSDPKDGGDPTNSGGKFPDTGGGDVGGDSDTNVNDKGE